MKFFYDFFTKNSRDVGGFWWLNISLEFWNLPSDWALPKRMFYKFCILRISPLQARIRGGGRVKFGGHFCHHSSAYNHWPFVYIFNTKIISSFYNFIYKYNFKGTPWNKSAQYNNCCVLFYSILVWTQPS